MIFFLMVFSFLLIIRINLLLKFSFNDFDLYNNLRIQSYMHCGCNINPSKENLYCPMRSVNNLFEHGRTKGNATYSCD